MLQREHFAIDKFGATTHLHRSTHANKYYGESSISTISIFAFRTLALCACGWETNNRRSVCALCDGIATSFWRYTHATRHIHLGNINEFVCFVLHRKQTTIFNGIGGRSVWALFLFLHHFITNAHLPALHRIGRPTPLPSSRSLTVKFRLFSALSVSSSAYVNTSGGDPIGLEYIPLSCLNSSIFWSSPCGNALPAIKQTLFLLIVPPSAVASIIRSVSISGRHTYKSEYGSQTQTAMILLPIDTRMILLFVINTQMWAATAGP